MIDFSKRSYEKELLDGNDIPLKDIEQNMRELEVINSRLGGHNITLEGFKKLLSTRRSVAVCEIGCGGGDNFKVIHQWAKKNNVEVKCTGVDINFECITYAKKNCKGIDIKFITSDYKYVMLEDKPDIAFCSLFCHHFTDEELINILHWMNMNSRVGFFINDLDRHPLAYYSIKAITSMFSKSYLVKNDAPLSVLRGFKKKEWEEILKEAGIKNYSVEWKWAFRHLIICYND
jgi:2-polyprenyl-3-methyl-5-hydroxy-6-metoxy-1,4-benzoquinol methylase